MVRGRYGEYSVLVDGQVVVDGGPLVIVGVMPSGANIVAKVREQIMHGEPARDRETI